MVLQNITPIMTSDTTPSPYTISASSLFSTNYFAYKALDGIDDGTQYNAWNSKGVNAWIKIDFGVNVSVSAISLTCRKYASYSQAAMPKQIVFSGSNDNVIFTEILTVENQTGWALGEMRTYVFPNEVGYRYYKILAVTSNGDANIIIGAIDFWKDSGYVSNKKASLNRCLPQNSTTVINLRNSDHREGFLGFANDGVNYGTFYLISKTGMAMLPMAGIKHEIIWSGSVVGYSNVVLTTSINNYKLFIVMHNSTHITVIQSDLASLTGTITRIIGIY